MSSQWSTCIAVMANLTYPSSLTVCRYTVVYSNISYHTPVVKWFPCFSWLSFYSCLSCTLVMIVAKIFIQKQQFQLPAGYVGKVLGQRHDAAKTCFTRYQNDFLVINQRTNIIKKDLEHNYFHELLVDHHLRVRHGQKITGRLERKPNKELLINFPQL